MLADLTFYKESFYGSRIPDDEFEKYETMAEDRLHALTFDRLIDGLPSRELSAIRVKKAVCALAELLFNIDMEAAAQGAVSDKTGAHGTVTSITAGSESVHYASSSQTSAGKAAGDEALKVRLIFEAAAPYLANVTNDEGVYLLYAGF